MTEKQKRELERTKQLVGDQQKELSNTRAQLARLSEIVDKQTKQLDTLRPDLAKSKALVDKYRQASEENGQLAVELRSKLEDVELQLKKFDNIKKEEGKITSELTAVGAQCRGERHEQVINRQREALNELRQRIKNLEQTRPSVPSTQQQMQQQIMLLKKQLAEVRASQALTDDIAKHANLGMYIMYIRSSLLTYCIIIILSLYLNLSPIIKIISYFYIKNLNLSAAIIIIGLRFNII
jgi:chromosome segregation ATPase